mmetsp:Transcript_94888/g.290264  ORF Transcript_94888/g.290264 Transcript_94888/m.290264 type:complete len:384 (+) Transcript_94888:594-1745(+)
MAADPELPDSVPLQRRNHVLRGGPEGNRAGVFGAVGHDVDHDASREARPAPLQAHALPALRRRGAAARLRRQRLGRGAPRGDPDEAGPHRRRAGHRLVLRPRAAAGHEAGQWDQLPQVAAHLAAAGGLVPPVEPALVGPHGQELLLPLREEGVLHCEGVEHGHPWRAEVRAFVPGYVRRGRGLERVQRHQQDHRAAAAPDRVPYRVPVLVQLAAAQGGVGAVSPPGRDVHQGRRPRPARLLLRPHREPPAGVPVGLAPLAGRLRRGCGRELQAPRGGEAVAGRHAFVYRQHGQRHHVVLGAASLQHAQRLHAARAGHPLDGAVVQGALPLELPRQGARLVPEVAQGVGAQPVAPPPAEDVEQAESDEHFLDHEVLPADGVGLG